MLKRQNKKRLTTSLYNQHSNVSEKRLVATGSSKLHAHTKTSHPTAHQAMGGSRHLPPEARHQDLIKLPQLPLSSIISQPRS
ncbi:hypothetical protein HF086_013543 [Spodoptera exigua]|uniref:Uncharacterized protein n=1 Tax=Spodoptera exigua TaxID=7107 RepID=A0A922MV40_SPOEX|nr:hypothetical protein HF086_013543 [Spodoptera exigua]